jgi:AcrR family transcriptional regulator
MNAGRTIRERARAELTREIKEAARRQLAAEGAQRLSVRAVERELGMVSSALYRYFPSRDDLLTALIVDAYDAPGGQRRAPQAPEIKRLRPGQSTMSAVAGARPVTRSVPGRSRIRMSTR